MIEVVEMLTSQGTGLILQTGNVVFRLETPNLYRHNFCSI